MLLKLDVALSKIMGSFKLAQGEAYSQSFFKPPSKRILRLLQA